MNEQKELPKVGSVFWMHKKKYHVAAFTDDCTGKTPKDLMLVRRWNKYSQCWVYEVWEIDDYFMVYLNYIKFEKGVRYDSNND